MTGKPQRVHVIDSHTGGEPTRVVISGGPDLGRGNLAELRERFGREHDEFRSGVISEPRGSEAMVGALLCEPTDPRCITGVIFFNNVGTIGMCGHGAIGVAMTLATLGRIRPGAYWFETPVGIVTIHYRGGSFVVVENVASYRLSAGVTVQVEGIGPVTGDVAWGGNWFFLIGEHGQDLTLANVEQLTAYTRKVRQALVRHGICGAGGAEVDHIELFGPPADSTADSRNFVLCPGGAYDRSPCGTGTSAKMACLYSDGLLEAGRVWRQEGILGTIFEGSLRNTGDQLIPLIQGAAFITGEANLLFDPADPFRAGIRT